MASTDPTLASSGERSSRALDLTDEINRRLAQAQGICDVIHGSSGHGSHRGVNKGFAWAATELIEQAQTAFKELKAVQS